ncbi:MAG: dTMP kinase [Desulfurococcales archaeon]|nr:dTMP kinase [Desulfurococcales archaeon]
MSRGVLIAFEGIDGSGLTTHSRLLVEWLNSMGYKSLWTKEPTDNSPFSGLLKSLLRRGNVNHFSLGLLFAADRMWHLLEDPSLPGNGIIGALSSGYVVVTDRYKYSSMAYQGSFTGIDYIWAINSRAPRADVLVYIDVPVDLALKRIEERGAIPDIYEKRELLTAIKESFKTVLSHAKKEGALVIEVSPVRGDREMPIHTVQNEIRNRVVEYLKTVKETTRA